MILESILTKHAKKFIDAKHRLKAAQGVTYENGYSYVTNGHMILRLGTQNCVHEAVVKSLNGKVIDVTPIKFDRLVPETPKVATVNVQEMLQAVKLMRDVLKSVKGELIELSVHDGVLTLSMAEAGLVSGSIRVGNSEPFYRKVNVSYMLTCLQVFDKNYETIDISAADNRVYPLQFTAGEVLTLLLPVR